MVTIVSSSVSYLIQTESLPTMIIFFLLIHCLIIKIASKNDSKTTMRGTYEVNMLDNPIIYIHYLPCNEHPLQSNRILCTCLQKTKVKWVVQISFYQLLFILFKYYMLQLEICGKNMYSMPLGIWEVCVHCVFWTYPN